MVSRIEFGQTRFGDFKIHTFRHTGWQKLVITGVSIGDRLTVPTPEFWSRLASCFNLPASTLSFLDSAELFHLLRDVASHRVLRYCIRHDADGSDYLVGVSDPNPDDPADQGVTHRSGAWHSRKLVTVN